MTMTATIKLRDVDNKVDPPTFIDTAWTIADQMATHLSHADEWRLTMTVDLDVRETVEDIIARESKDNG